MLPQNMSNEILSSSYPFQGFSLSPVECPQSISFSYLRRISTELGIKQFNMTWYNSSDKAKMFNSADYWNHEISGIALDCFQNGCRKTNKREVSQTLFLTINTTAINTLSHIDRKGYLIQVVVATTNTMNTREQES